MVGLANAGAEGFLGWLLTASLQGAVLAAIVLAVRLAAGERVPARWRAWLWGLVLVRLALPFGVPSSVSVFNAPRWAGLEHAASLSPVRTPAVGRPTLSDGTGRASGIGPVAPVGSDLAAHRRPDRAGGEAGPPAATGAPLDPSLSPSAILLACWGAGVLAMAVGVAAAHLRLRRTLWHSRPMRCGRIIDAVEAARAELGLRTPVTVAENPRTGSPLVVGALRPALLLPEGLGATLSDGELRGVVLHELAHVKRRDIAAGWLATAVLALHWFNPLAWAAVRAMRQDRELACDALALEHMNDVERPVYGRTLLKLIEECPRRGVVPGLAAIVEHRGDMRRRITMIARHRKPSMATTLVATGLVGLLGVVGLTDAREERAQAAAQAQPASAGGSDHRLYTAAYEADKAGRIRLPDEARWIVMPRYNGMDAEGNPITDERITVVLADEAGSFWPVICKLSTPDAEALHRKLTGSLERIGDAGLDEPIDASMFTKGLRRGEHGMIELRRAVLDAFPVGAGEGQLVAITLGPPRAQEPPFAARMGVGAARSLATQLRDQLSAKQGGQAAAPAARGPRADMTATEALRAALARVGDPARLNKSDHFIYTQGLRLGELGVGRLPHGTTFRVLPGYSGTGLDGNRVVDERITLVLQDPERAFWPAISWLSLEDAKSLRDKIGDAIAADGGLEAGTERVHPMIGTRPYQILEHGLMPLPEWATIEVLPQYRGTDGERTIVDDRVTVVIADAQARFWALIVPLDADDAAALEEALDEQIRAKGG